jgi:signal transduction histidine kinase
MTAAPASTAIGEGFPWAAFHTEESRLRWRQSVIGCVLTMILVPAGALMDHLVYPGHAGGFLVLRTLLTVGVCVLLALHFTDVGRRHIRVLNLTWLALPVLGIAGMIQATDGLASPYYAGLLLVITGASVLFPWSLGESIAFCVIVIITYVVACTLNPAAFSASLGGNNLFFLTATSAICITSGHYSGRRRQAEFHLRHQLDRRNGELQASYAQLSELDRQRSQFFSNISHELRTPLTLILAPLEDTLRERRGLDDRTAEALAIARHNAQRLLKLINDLLALVRIDAGVRPSSVDRIDLAEVVPGIARSMQYLIEAKGLTLACDGGVAGLPVEADHASVEKILLNLLSNAVKFTPRGGTIRVGWRADAESAVVTVADSGIGIPEIELPHIFNRFRQVDGSTTRQYQGIGIGLSLVKELVEAHAGTIQVVSRSGAGTTMTVRLPLARGATPATPATPAGDSLAALYRAAERQGSVTLDEGVEIEREPAVGNGAWTVLVVDDEPDMRRYLVSRLTDRHRVIQSDHGQRALDLVRSARPDLVLLDLMLPGLDGIAVCRAIRASPELADVRIILLTARMDEASKIAALDAGADDFLSKPFSTPELVGRVGTQLRSLELQRDLRRKSDELAQSLERLQAAESQLIHSERMGAVGVLAAGLLHELNNPLNYAMTALDVGRTLPPSADPMLKDILSDVDEGLQRIRHLVSDLGLFAFKHREHSHERLPLDAAIDLAMRLVSYEIADISVERHREATWQVDGMIQGSLTQLSQVFVNLLVNAAKAIKERRAAGGGSGGIAVAVRRVAGSVVATVRDQGTGIPPEHLQRIFEPFFTTRKVGEGTGLGLSICHAIIQSHQGTITVDSRAGAWTEFTVALPIAPGHSHEEIP